MILNDALNMERKNIAILQVLSEAQEPLGSRLIARALNDRGICMSERAVRYHMQIMDERALTQGESRDGRVITPSGREELRNARVWDRLGFVISRIELLSFTTDFDAKKQTGPMPVNISYIPHDSFAKAMEAVTLACVAGLGASDRVLVRREREVLGDDEVPAGRAGVATVCSVVVNAAMMKAGIAVDCRFGGLLEMRQGKPLRFVELISFAGSSLAPSVAFIRGKMTTVREVALGGEGKILADFVEIPAPCRNVAEKVMHTLSQAGIAGPVLVGNPNEPVCGIPVGMNRVGLVLLDGLNPLAAVEEAGIPTENRAIFTTMDYGEFKSLR